MGIYQNITLTCRICCTGDITGYVSVFLSKQNAGCSSEEVPGELSGWNARREACARVTCRWDVLLQGLHGCPENYENEWRFRPRLNEAERQRGFSEKQHSHLCVCAFQPSLTLSYSTHTYISAKIHIIKRKRRRKEAYYIRVVVVLPCIQQKEPFKENISKKKPCLTDDCIIYLSIFSLHLTVVRFPTNYLVYFQHFPVLFLSTFLSRKLDSKYNGCWSVDFWD